MTLKAERRTHNPEACLVLQPVLNHIYPIEPRNDRLSYSWFATYVPFLKPIVLGCI
jgi:hypothetical protein